MTHIRVSKLTIIGSDNGLSPGRRQAIIRANAGILLIRPLGTNFSELLVEILIFSFKKMRLKVSSAKRRPFCLGLNELRASILSVLHQHKGFGQLLYLAGPKSWVWQQSLLNHSRVSTPMFTSLTVHDDVIKWKHFPHNWPFMRGIHRSGVFPAQRPVTRSFGVFFDLRLNKRLSKQSWGWWFEKPPWSLWRQCT